MLAAEGMEPALMIARL